jgi:hypothetical protein
MFAAESHKPIGASTIQNNISSGFMEEIENRLKARAGNPPSQTKVDKQNPVKEEKPKFGKGISETDINKIIREFNS